MASGTPVVVSDRGALPELVGPGTGVVAAAPTPDAMATAVRDLFAQDRDSMGAQARQWAQVRWAWTIQINQLRQTYEQLVGIRSAIASDGYAPFQQGADGGAA